MKRLIYILSAFIALPASAQFYVNGATVHNNGATVFIQPPTTNNAGLVNNLGSTHFAGGYDDMPGGLLTNQAVTDTIYCAAGWDITEGFYDGANMLGNNYMGALVFNSTGPQSLNSLVDGTSGEAYNLVFAGGGLKNLNGTLITFNTIRFANGIVRTTAADSLGLVSDGGIIGSPGITSHVNGPFYREGHSSVSDLFYPVGDGVRYRPLWFKNLPVGAPVPAIGVETINGATGATAGLGIDNMVDTRHWHIEHIDGDYQGAPIELSYGAVEGITDQTQLVVAQSDTPGGTYKSLDQSGTTGAAGAGTVISEFNGTRVNLMIGESANLRVDVNANLEGAWTGAAMHDSLYAGAYGNILASHYEVGNAGANNYGIDMLEGYNVPSGAATPVDVVLLALRDGANPAGGDLDYTYGWLMTDGSIRDFLSGTKDYVTFSSTTLTPGNNYTLVVYHRNHVPLMFSSGASPFGLNVTQNTAAPQFFDLSNPVNIYGTGFKTLGTEAALYIGNAEQGNSPLEVNAFDLWVVGNDAQNVLPNNDLIDTDVTLSGETNQTDWDKTKWANDQLYFSTIP